VGRQRRSVPGRGPNFLSRSLKRFRLISHFCTGCARHFNRVLCVNIAVYLVGYTPYLVLFQVTKLAQKCWESVKVSAGASTHGMKLPPV
jgi:hypothetical protein